MRSHKDDRMQRGKTLIEERSACLVSNLSEFRSPICHHVDLASMGMHPKFCKLRIAPGNLKTLPTWNPCLVWVGGFPRNRGCPVWSTGAIAGQCAGRPINHEYYMFRQKRSRNRCNAAWCRAQTTLYAKTVLPVALRKNN